jgi:aryl-alcohol dehydrogenase-like predicted oxidoreductase
VQLQWWNLSLPAGRTAQELSRLRAAGAIAEIGVTNFPAGPLTVLLDAGVPVISNQVQVSLLDPRAQAHVLPLCKARNLSVLGYGPLAGGFLSDGWYGKPDPGLEPHGDRPFGRIYRQLIERFGGWSWLQELLQVLAACGGRHHTDIAAIALAWTLAHSGAAALLVGIGSAHRPVCGRRASRPCPRPGGYRRDCRRARPQAGGYRRCRRRRADRIARRDCCELHGPAG